MNLQSHFIRKGRFEKTDRTAGQSAGGPSRTAARARPRGLSSRLTSPTPVPDAACSQVETWLRVPRVDALFPFKQCQGLEEKLYLSPVIVCVQHEQGKKATAE